MTIFRFITFLQFVTNQLLRMRRGAVDGSPDVGMTASAAVAYTDKDSRAIGGGSLELRAPSLRSALCGKSSHVGALTVLQSLPVVVGPADTDILVVKGVANGAGLLVVTPVGRGLVDLGCNKARKCGNADLTAVSERSPSSKKMEDSHS